MRNIALFVLGVAIWGLLIAANTRATPEREQLTLEEAIDIAQERNLGFRGLQQERAIAKGQICEARSKALPHLDLTSQYIRQDEIASFGGIPVGQLDNYEATAELSQTLYAGGGVRAALQLAREHAKGLTNTIEHTRSALIYTVQRLFYRVLLEKRNLEVAKKAIQLAKRNLDEVRSRSRQGAARKFDLMRAEERFSSSRSDAIAAENALQKARSTLLNNLDLPLENPPRLVGKLERVSRPNSTSNALATALVRRNDLNAARHAVAGKRELLAIARSSGRAKAQMFAQYRYANPDRNFNDRWETSWMAGMRVEIPLFDGFYARGKVVQSKGNLKKAQLERKDLRSRVQLEIDNALADVQTAERMLTSRKQDLNLAKESLELVRSGYREGVQTQTDLLQTQLILTKRRHEYAQAIFQNLMTNCRLKLAMGVLGER